MTLRFDELDKLAAAVIEVIDAAEKTTDETMAGLAPGTERVTGIKNLLFLQKMQEMYPPEMWMTPDGQVVMVSPFMAALGYIEGGRQVMTAAAKALEKVEREMVQPAPAEPMPGPEVY